MNWLKHINLRLLLVVIPVLMAVASSTAQITVSTGQTSPLSVDPVAGDTYTWELYDTVTGVNFAVDQGNCPANEAFFAGGLQTGPVVNVTWLTPGVFFFKVTATRANCTMNLKVGKVIVLENLPTASIAQPSPVCTGDTAQLSITLSGEGPWSIVLFDGANNVSYTNISSSPYLVPVNPLTNTIYQITEVTDANGTNSTPSQAVELMIKPRPVSSHIYQY